MMTSSGEEISITPPKFSLGKVFSTLKDNVRKDGPKGILNSLEDVEQGPHVHLTLLLITVVIVSLGIIVLSKVI